MDVAVRAWLLAQLGENTPIPDLQNRYTRLGNARAVALEVLRGRLAALLQQPATVNVPNAVGVGFGENIKALERQIANLEAGVPSAPDDPAPPVADVDEDGDPFGVLFLQARNRR